MNGRWVFLGRLHIPPILSSGTEMWMYCDYGRVYSMKFHDVGYLVFLRHFRRLEELVVKPVICFVGFGGSLSALKEPYPLEKLWGTVLYLPYIFGLWLLWLISENLLLLAWKNSCSKNPNSPPPKRAFFQAEGNPLRSSNLLGPAFFGGPKICQVITLIYLVNQCKGDHVKNRWMFGSYIGSFSPSIGREKITMGILFLTNSVWFNGFGAFGQYVQTLKTTARRWKRYLDPKIL